MRFLILVLLFSVFFISCEDNTVIKPSAMLRLEYPSAKYHQIKSDCPYTFNINKNALLQVKDNCGININYPFMKATVFLTYQKVQNHNMDSLLYDAQKLTYEHNIKAQGIPEQPFVNKDENAYGMFYMINGNAATQAQFYITDSINHFVTASLYFDAKPNFDSIYPAVMYLRNDMRTMMETMKWKNNF